MRILVFSQYFHPHKGGVETYIRDLYYHLIECYHEVEVDLITYCNEEIPSYDLFSKLNIYRIPCWEIFRDQFAVPNYFVLVKLLLSLRSRFVYDAINTHSRFFDHSWWAWIVAKIFNSRSILSLHSADSLFHKSTVIRLLSLLLDRIFGLFIIKKYDVVTAVCAATQKFALSLNGNVAPLLIPYGISLSKSYHGCMDISVSQNLIKLLGTKKSEDSVVVSYVGRMIEDKGVKLLYESAKILSEDYPNVHFYFGGKGSFYDEMSQSHYPNITFLGSLNTKEVGYLLRRTDIFAYPTQMHEGLPITILEAAANKCAVITTAKGGIKEIIHDGENGLIMEDSHKDLVKKLILLIEDKYKRERLALLLNGCMNSRKWEDIVPIFFDTLLNNN